MVMDLTEMSDTATPPTTDTRPSITALTALREGWPTELTPVIDDDGDWDGKFDHSDNEHTGEGYLECNSDGMDEAPRFAALIAAEHNATPVLLEVVAAALAWEDSTSTEVDHQAAVRACHDLLTALTKVRP